MTPARRPTHTPHRPIRIEDDLWRPLGKLVGDRNRSALIREFVAWYLRKPGARLPERPPRHAEAGRPAATDPHDT